MLQINAEPFAGEVRAFRALRPRGVDGDAPTIVVVHLRDLAYIIAELESCGDESASPEMPCTGHTAWITDMHTLRAFRGRGINRALFRHLCTLARTISPGAIVAPCAAALENMMRRETAAAGVQLVNYHTSPNPDHGYSGDQEIWQLCRHNTPHENNLPTDFYNLHFSLRRNPAIR